MGRYHIIYYAGGKQKVGFLLNTLENKEIKWVVVEVVEVEVEGVAEAASEISEESDEARRS